MIKRLALLVLFCAAPVFAQAGGATAMPPSGDQISATQAPNSGNFENDSLVGYGHVNASAVLDNTQNHTPSGTWSLKSTIASGPTNTKIFDFGMVLHNHESLVFCAWVKTDASFASTDGQAFNIGFSDNTHGFGAVLQTNERQYTKIGASSNWEHLCSEQAINKFEHGADGAMLVAVDTKQTAGTMWLDDITIGEDWYPIRNFVAAPNYRGYVWKNEAPVERNIRTPVIWNVSSSTVDICHNPIIGMICGVAEIDPPPTQTLSSVTFTETIDSTDTTCTHPIATKTIASPSAAQTWSFVPTDYGGLPATGTVYYVCSKLNVTSGGALIDTYPAWKLVFEDATFQAGLNDWYDVDNAWIHNGVRSMLIGNYDDLTSALCSVCIYTTKSAYETQIAGTGRGILPTASATAGNLPNAKAQGNRFAEYAAQHFTSIMGNLVGNSALNPTSGSDQLTPQFAAFADFGESLWQILNNLYGNLVNEDSITAGPSAPTVGATTGTFNANFGFVELAAGGTDIPQGSTRTYGITLASSAATVNWSTSPCAGTNCGFVITTPTCPTTRWLGYQVFVATNSTSSVPANSSFNLVEPSSILVGQLSEGDFVPCGVTFTIANPDANGINSPAVDTTKGAAGTPGWVGASQTYPSVWGLFATAYCGNPTPAGGAGVYVYDEPSFYGLRSGFYTYTTLRADCNKFPVAGVLIDPTMGFIGRDVMDVIGKDPYLFNVASPEEWLAGVNVSSPTTCNAYSTNNTIVTSNQCYFSRAHLYSFDVGLETYGYRPTWNVIRQFGTGTWKGLTYDLMRRQLWGALINDQNFGNLGPGILGWQWGGTTGMLNTWNNGDTNAWADSQRAFGEISDLKNVLLTPVVDSTELNGGTGSVVGATGEQVNSPVDISNVAITAVGGGATTVAAQCNINGKGAFYTNAINFPFGPVLWVSHNYTLTNTALVDEYFFTVNQCDSSFTVTFGLPSVPAVSQVEVLNEGRTIPISTSGCPNSTAACFTDTWTSLDTHQYVLRAKYTAVIH